MDKLSAGGAANQSPEQKIAGQRYLSLDVLRGLTIALMVVVNNPGSWGAIYAPFEHAAWHGFTPTDLVFPTFLFVVGNAMVFSMKKLKENSDSEFLTRVFKRTAMIFLAGLLLTIYPLIKRSGEGDFILKDLSAVRIMGVLQRIAVCYFFASLIIRYFTRRGAVIFSILILFFYWGIMYYFGNPADRYSLEGNAALKFDLLLIRPENLYHGFGIPFDPEGLLSCLPAIVNVIAGYLTASYIQKNGHTNKTVLRMALSGAALLALSLIHI